VSDINTVVVDSLKELDPEWPIREEKREPVSDINTVVVDSLRSLTLNGRLEKRKCLAHARYDAIDL